jgi:hypothetical protein
VGSAEAKHELPKPWKPTFPPSKTAEASAPPVPAKPPEPPTPEPPPRALTEPPPLPEPPERGSKELLEASVVVAEELGATTSNTSDLTDLVAPLKLGVDTEPVRKTARRSPRRILYAGAALAIFAAAALAVVLATSAELPKPVVTRRTPIVVPEASPVTVAPKAELVGAAAAPAPSPAIEAVVNTAPVVEAAAVAQPQPAPVKPVVRRAIAHPVKKAAKAKYDPDALFFKGN